MFIVGNTVPPANTSPPASGKNHDIQRAPPPKEPSTAPVHKSPTRGNLKKLNKIGSLFVKDNVS